MGIAAMVLGIISLVTLLTFILHIPIPNIPGIPALHLSLMAIRLLVPFVGLILGIFTLVKSKAKNTMAVAGVVMCSFGVIATTLILIILVGHA